MTDFSFQGINFKITNSAARICCVGSGAWQAQTALVDASTKIVKIPSFAKNENNEEYAVTMITAYAFWKTGVEIVVISNTIEEIDHAAFAYASSLEQVIFETGSRIRNLGPRIFQGSLIKEVVVPPNIKGFNMEAFQGAEQLTDVIFCGNFKFSDTFRTTNASIKAHVPTNFKYSSFGGITIVKDKYCLPIRVATHCLKRQSSFFVHAALFLITK